MMKLESLDTLALAKTPKNNTKILVALILKKKAFCQGAGKKQLNRKSVPKIQNFD